jgi:hypothetical protein
MCWALNHQNNLEMAQGHISLSPVSDARARAHESSFLGVDSWVQRSRTATRNSTALPKGRRRRQKRWIFKGSGIKVPCAWPDKTIKHEGHMSVSRRDRHSRRRDRRRVGSDYVSKYPEATRQSLFRLWLHLQARILPWGGPEGHCRYPETRVPPATVQRRRTHAAIP